MSSAEILSVEELLSKALYIPEYQRPYKWSINSINALITDISNAIDESKRNNDFKYRLGTVIVHKNNDKDVYEIVDGQQRIVSLTLIKKCIDKNFENNILSFISNNNVTEANVFNNYRYIKEWFSLNKAMADEFLDAFGNTLEVVLLTVDELSEAFQLFDSQNTRGRALDPHDLLKAYHLREMKNQEFDMKTAVTKWENKDTNDIRNLFDTYLYPIYNWSKCRKTGRFTDKEIDVYKGISENSGYTYAKSASRISPYYQLMEPIIAGNDFFEMVDHYLNMLENVKNRIITNEDFSDIKSALHCDDKIKSVKGLDEIKGTSVGFRYSKNLFFCALLFYYDRFHNFDVMAVKKLFVWAFMLRVDMQNLGFDSINKYAVGGYNSKYSNNVPMFSVIANARLHTEISGIQLNMSNESPEGERARLKSALNEMLGA